MYLNSYLFGGVSRGHAPKKPNGSMQALCLQPLHLLGGQLDIERRKAVFQLGDRPRSNQRDDRERLGDDIGKRDVDRIAPELLGKLDRPIAALEIPFGIPAAHDLLVIHLAATGAVCEETAA